MHWGSGNHKGQCSSVRVFHPNAADSYRDKELDQINQNHENKRKCLLIRRVLDIKQGTFTPLVFRSTGGMGEECLRFHSRWTLFVVEFTKMACCLSCQTYL